MKLKQPYQLMVLVAGCLGLRASEVVALRWHDFDWDTLTVVIRRGSVHGRIGETKTEASQKAVPLDPGLATEILAHRQRSVYLQPTDYVFAGDSGRPRWQETILTGHIKPAAVQAKIAGKVGWHTLRHSYSTLLRALGTNVKVQQELLRHAVISTTLNIYTQAVSEQKREAVTKIARLLLPQNAEGPSDRPLAAPTCTRLM